MKRALILALLLATPAAAQTQQEIAEATTQLLAWRACVQAEMDSRDIASGSVGWIAVNISNRCKFPPLLGEEVAVNVIVGMVEKYRNDAPIVGPSKPMPPADKRY